MASWRNPNKMSQSPLKLSNQIQRILTAAVLIPLVLLVVLYGHETLFCLILSAISLLALYEFYSLLEIKGISCFTWLGLGLGLLLNLACLKDNPSWIIAVATLSVLACLVYAILQRGQQSQVVPAVAGTLLGLFYLPWLLNYLLYLRRLAQGRWLLILLFFAVWACDSGAYYVGSRLGKYKLAPNISPGKTIEGAIGGLGLSILVFVMARIWLADLSITTAIMLGLGVGIIAQVGDLCESQIKRWAGVKDTGSLIPGHGGMLDRIDSLIFAAPFFYYCSDFILKQ